MLYAIANGLDLFLSNNDHVTLTTELRKCDPYSPYSFWVSFGAESLTHPLSFIQS